MTKKKNKKLHTWVVWPEGNFDIYAFLWESYTAKEAAEEALNRGASFTEEGNDICVAPFDIDKTIVFGTSLHVYEVK